MAPIQLPPFSLSMIAGSSLIHGAVLLGVAAALFWWARRLQRRGQLCLQAVALLLLLRVIFIYNPWSWDVYATYLGAGDVGWRQRDVIRIERQKFLKQPVDLEYLAVGSSQTDALFRSYATEHEQLEVFALAGLFPLDFVLYREYIAAYRPQVILLHLSEFDMARLHSPERAVMAPPQGLYLPRLLMQLRAFPQGRDYDRAWLDMAVGELFPEYKFGFVFRALVDEGLRARSASEQPAADVTGAGPDDENGSLEHQIAELARRIDPAGLDFNFFFLEQFLDFCGDQDIRVVITEGQYRPAARAMADQTVNNRVRQRLVSLAAERDGVQYLDLGEVFEFTDLDFVDLVHVRPEVGYKVTGRLLESLAGDKREADL